MDVFRGNHIIPSLDAFVLTISSNCCSGSAESLGLWILQDKKNHHRHLQSCTWPISYPRLIMILFAEKACITVKSEYSPPLHPALASWSLAACSPIWFRIALRPASVSAPCQAALRVQEGRTLLSAGFAENISKGLFWKEAGW